MQKPERSSYSVLDFIGWRQARALEVSPKFQRRSVWSRAARSYLIDTLILGFPVPPLYVRVTQSEDGKRTVREIVDGQQRIRAVLDYVDGAYTLANNIKSPCAGKSFESLPEEAKNKIRHYAFITEVFYGISDEDVLAIFARLNANSVRLNAQELRNGKYFGQFKQLCYELSLSHLTFWRKNRLFSEQGIARMQEAELTSELIVAMLAGMQDKKKTISTFYERYDDSFPEKDRINKEFTKTIDQVVESIGDDLKNSQFRRTPLFYSLFLVVYDRLYGLKGYGKAVVKNATLSSEDREKLRDAIVLLSEVVAEGRAGEEVPKGYQAFVNACLTQTDNIRPRQIRFETISKLAFE